MAVRIRMKRMGRRHWPFFRVCAVDRRSSRDGKVIEYLGYYDPMVGETDARAVLQSERIDYWLGVGAQPSDRVAVLIKKYGTNGTHLEKQQAAFGRLQANKPKAPPAVIPQPAPEKTPKPVAEAAPEAASSPEVAADAPSAAEETQEPATTAAAEETAPSESQEKTE